MASRNTVQQKIIAQQLALLANHPTADEVYRAVNAEHPSISKATVYRTLNKMAQNGTATKVRLNNGADHFDHQTHDHYHVVCSQCGKVSDISIGPLFPSQDQKTIEEESGFIITGHSFQVEGICPACQAAGLKD